MHATVHSSTRPCSIRAQSIQSYNQTNQCRTGTILQPQRKPEELVRNHAMRRRIVNVPAIERSGRADADRSRAHLRLPTEVGVDGSGEGVCSKAFVIFVIYTAKWRRAVLRAASRISATPRRAQSTLLNFARSPVLIAVSGTNEDAALRPGRSRCRRRPWLLCRLEDDRALWVMGDCHLMASRRRVQQPCDRQM